MSFLFFNVANPTAYGSRYEVILHDDMATKAAFRRLLRFRILEVQVSRKIPDPFGVGNFWEVFMVPRDTEANTAVLDEKARIVRVSKYRNVHVG